MPADRVPSDADFERLLRQQYAPLCTDHDYQRLRRKCGLGPVIDGETITPSERTPTVPDTTPTSLPDQPDGIDDDSRDLPDPRRAARRVRAYLTAWGDGLIDSADPGDGHPRPLYARDLEALTRAADGQLGTPAVAAWASLLQEAQQERDRYLSMLTDIGDAISPTGERPAEAIGTLVDDIQALDERARAELTDLRRQFTRIVTNAGSHYQQLIVAARCASSGTDATADYWRWNGNAQALRETTNEIARVAGITPPDWEQIKADIPADGIYRTTTKETGRA